MRSDAKIKLTRKFPEFSDGSWIDLKIMDAKAGDPEAMNIVNGFIVEYAKSESGIYSYTSMKNGYRIYPDEYESVFIRKLWHMYEKYTGGTHFITFVISSRMFQLAAIDVSRSVSSRRERINRTAASFDKVEYEIETTAAGDNPEQSFLSRELITFICEHPDIDDRTKQIAKMVYDGYSYDEITTKLELSNKMAVGRYLQKLKPIILRYMRD